MLGPQTLLWIAGIVCDVALVTVIASRRRHGTLPYFFAFVAFLGMRDLGLFAIHWLTAPRYLPYFLAYWFSDAVVVVLRLFVLREIFMDVAGAYEGAFHAVQRAFRYAGGILAGVAVASALLDPGSGPSQLITGIQLFHRSVTVFEAGSLLSLLVLTSVLGMRWRRYTFGAALGLTLYSALQIPAATLAAEFGKFLGPSISLLNSAAYLCALVVWIACCAAVNDELYPALPVPNVAMLKQAAQGNYQFAELWRR